ncbi:MAG: hypothetical protein KDI44_01345 [Thiothrix sp.]|nr:hypothetical protein [Thiothrix sp.]HPQ94112.1 hypothetical protein [Thiolinea sp.]
MKNRHSDPRVDVKENVTENVKSSRRVFLRQSVTVGAGAVLLAGQVEAAPTPEPQAGTPAHQDQGYRVTPHITAYYQSAS